MSMSFHVFGIRPPDDKWRRMKRVYDACTDAGIDPPNEVLEFFGGESPDEAGILIDLKRGHPCVRQYSNAEAAEEGVEIDIDDLPENISMLRVVNGW